MGNTENSSISQKEQQSGDKPRQGPKYRMRLFVAGDEANSRIAVRNINAICSSHLEGEFELKIIDVFEDFEPAIRESILVTPALLIDAPKRTKILGNLQDEERILSALGVK